MKKTIQRIPALDPGHEIIEKKVKCHCLQVCLPS